MLKVKGNRLLVKKETIDCGGMKLTPNSDLDGLNNTGKIEQVGSWRLWIRGFRVGQIILFRKHFITNAGQLEENVFVESKDIVAIKSN